MIQSRGKTKKVAPHALHGWLALLLLLAGSIPAHAGAASAAQPAAQIPVAPLGYQAPGPLYLLSRISFGTLDFIDSKRILFTFHEIRLLRRENNDSSGEGQMIHALVLNLPDGRVTASADWLMGDKDQYLWPLGNGRFLVREGDIYYTTDATLKLHLLFGSPNPVLLTEVSPDGRLLIVEVEYETQTPDPQPGAAARAGPLGEPAPDKGVELAMVNVDTKVLQAAFRVTSPIDLPVSSAGYLAQVRPKGNNYELRFVPFQGKQVTLGSLSSICVPQENFISSKAILIESCDAKTNRVLLDAWTTDGKKLWHGVRDPHDVWPTFATAEKNGSRFAMGLLQCTHSIDLVSSLTNDDLKQQLVQVFDIETGAVLLETNASPILSAGQNFALSPDGNHLAVLRKGAIEIYDVPAQPSAARSRK